LPPSPRAAIPHLLGQLLPHILLPAILRRDFSERRTDHVRVDCVACRAGVLRKHALHARALTAERLSGRSGRTSRRGRDARRALRTLTRRPRYGRRLRLGFEGAAHTPAPFGSQPPPVPRHAFRPSLKDRLKPPFTRAALPPAAIHEARPDPTRRAPTVTSVAV